MDSLPSEKTMTYKYIYNAVQMPKYQNNKNTTTLQS